MTKTQDVPYVGGQAKAPLTRWLAHARARRVSPFLQGDVLELGCGGSTLLDSESMRRTIRSYTGVEALPQNVETLRRRFPDATFRAFDLDATPWPIEGKFHCVLAMAVIEHLWNLGSLFQEVGRLLHDGGRFVLTTPTPWGNHVVLRTLARTGLVRKTVIDDHVTIFNKQLFRHVCNEFGFELEHYRTFQLGGNQLAVLRKR
jgi:SAM-dependent methyltransferase